MEIMEESKSFEILRNAFEQQLINDGFVEHSGYSLGKNQSMHILMSAWSVLGLLAFRVIA